MKGGEIKCHFLDLNEKTGFFMTTLEEDGFSPLKLNFSPLNSNFSQLNSKEKEEDALNLKEDAADSIKQMI
jgi:hypothetical protein